MRWGVWFLGLASSLSAGLSLGGEGNRWTPGPAALHIGSIGDGSLLSYQWEPSQGPEWREPPSRAKYLVPAERWLAAEQFKPRDIRWLVADLARGRVTPLVQIMPQEAKLLGIIPMRTRRHNAFHRWRLAWGRFLATSLRCDAAMYPEAFLLSHPFRFKQQAPARGGRGPTPWPSSAQGLFAPEEAPAARKDRETPAPAGAGNQSPETFLRIPYSTAPFLASAAVLRPDGGRRRKPAARIDFDFVPVSENLQREFVVFFVLAGDCISVWRNQCRWPVSERPRLSLNPAPWECLGSCRAPFAEPFHAAQTGGKYFLVTDESGKVYLAEQREGEWNTREVWTDSERPIIAMIHFADGRPPYVFGKDFYFRLARKPRVNPCRDVTRGSEELGDPMRTVWECAKVLHEARELSDGPPARRAAAGQD